jgi:hypothetical protein
MGLLPPAVAKLRVHPAIGIARLSTADEQGDYYFVYGKPPADYKSKSLMKRQAVQFRLITYDAQNRAIEELTADRLDSLGIDAVWRVRAANLKISRQMGKDAESLRAEASSDRTDGRLVAQLPSFDEGADIPLGRITPQGLFIPPRAGVFRRRRTDPIPADDQLQSPDFSDNTSDGPVTVTLTDRNTGRPINVLTLGARVLVTPKDYSPDVNDDDPGLFPRPKKTLEKWLVDSLGLPNQPPPTPLNQTAREFDRAALRPGTSTFAPGIEIHPLNLPGGGTLRDRLYPSSQTGDPDEVRVRPKTGPGDAGSDPGELTSGLCSPWQFDFILCTCNYWAAQRPDKSFKDPASADEVRWLRRRVADTGATPPVLETPKDIIDHVDQLGVVRRIGGRRVETERTEDIP